MKSQSKPLQAGDIIVVTGIFYHKDIWDPNSTIPVNVTPTTEVCIYLGEFGLGTSNVLCSLGRARVSTKLLYSDSVISKFKDVK